jgi:hypothetical protein
LARFKKILLIILTSVIALLVALWLLIQMPPVQNWLIGKITNKLSQDLKTKIAIQKVNFSLFNKMYLQGVLIEDRQKDTILSAGEIAVNITDWFFLKKNIELKYIGLKNAYIHLQRTDSVWRHQFLLDYFSTPASKNSNSKNQNINIALKELDLKNITFKQTDAWLGQDMTLSFASLYTNPKTVDFAKKIIEINSIEINKPYFALRSYKRNKPRRKRLKISPVIKQIDSSELDWNPEKWNIVANKISLHDGIFKNDSRSEMLDSTAFDGNHILFSKINIDFTNVKWNLDTITANMELSTKERSGFEVKHFTAKAKVTPKQMSFHDLNIHTNKSFLSNYFCMKYSDFSAMNDFVDSVKLEGIFDKSEISSDDIAFFAPVLKTWKKNIIFSGKVNGPVVALDGRNLELQTGENTKFFGDATLTGLPDINNTIIKVNAAPLNIAYSDALSFLPSLKNTTTPDLKTLQYLNFTGNFTGSIYDFITTGTIKTALGNIIADVNMKIPSGKNPVYSGNIATENFNVGALFNNSQIGFVNMSAKLAGSGFDAKENQMALQSKINYIDYNEYRYQNISIDGNLSKNIFDGLLAINDSNATLTLTGLIHYAEKIPQFDFLSHIQILNFKPLNLTKNNLSLAGKITANFVGNNIDDFLGNANISNAVLLNNGNPLSFDSLSLTSTTFNGEKFLTLRSTEFSAALVGVFNISELPNSFKVFLSRYYPAYIPPPKVIPQNQSFSFDIETHFVDELVPLFDSSLAGFSNSRIAGNINTFTNELALDANVPWFKIQQYGFSNALVKAVGNYDSITLNGKTSNMIIGDSLTIEQPAFDIIARNDISNVKIFSGSQTAFDQARLNAVVKTYNDGVNILFEPSSFMLDGKTWTIQDKGELEFRKNVPAHGELVLREGFQEILVKTVSSNLGNWNDISIDIKNLNLGDFAPYFLPNNRLEGQASATVFLENPGKEMKIFSNNFSARAIRFDNDSIGDINANFSYNVPTDELIVKGKTLNPLNKNLGFDVHLYLKNQESQEKNSIALQANQFDLKYLNRFLNFLFSDITGEITGNFQIKGPLNALSVEGKGKLKNAGLKINFTQCYYAIEDREIELTENEINLNGIVLRDTITKNPIYLSGSIMHNAFENMFFDVTVSTRKPGTRDPANNRPVQVLKTSYKDNQLFYGDVKATGSFVLVGPAANTYMKIDAIASDEYESAFTISPASSKAGQMPEWLVERKFGTEMADSLFRNATASNMTYELDVTANQKVLMKFVMDDVTGDEIAGRGHGTLNIKSGTRDPLTIRGRYDIDEGNYNFTFQSFFKKPFEIIKGTENFISWNGDPMNATINFNAMYHADRVSFSPLAAGSDIDASYSNTRENVFVTAKLTGNLFKPAFQFGIELDPNSRYNNDFNVMNALQQIQRKPEEVTRQVTYLIVFNSFAPPETGVANAADEFGNAAKELAYSTLSGIVFNEINKKLNDELGKLLGNKVSFAFNGSAYNRDMLSSQANLNVNVSGALKVPLFNDRFVISLGSSMEVPVLNSVDQTVQFLPDVTLEWLLNQSGTVHFNFFYRESLDPLNTSGTGASKLKRGGSGISFRKEFDRVGELFTNVRRRTLREVKTTPFPADTLKKDTTINVQEMPQEQ